MTDAAHRQYVEASREAERVSKVALADLIGVVSRMHADGGYMPDALAKAWETYSAAIADHQNLAVTEANRRRTEHNEMNLHYVAAPGDRHTICGRHVDGGNTPHGYVGPDNEFYLRRVAQGGNVCIDCEQGIKGA